MSDFKDKFDNWLDDAWKVDTFIDEYNWEQNRKAKHKKPLCKEVKRQQLQPSRKHFVAEHTAIALSILGGLAVLSDRKSVV